jgi:F-type H+-transporting ATPase subunit delta
VSETNAIITSLDLVYAQALLELAVEAGSLQTVYEEVNALQALSAANPDLDRLLGSRMLGREQRAGLVKKLFEGRVNPLVYKFLMVLNSRDRLHSWKGIVSAFGQVYEKHLGIQAVTAYVPSKLDDAEAKRIAEALGVKLSKKVRLEQEVDPDLIGGIKIRVGDNVIDGSVQAQLRLIRADLLAAGRVKAAQAVGKA